MFYAESVASVIYEMKNIICNKIMALQISQQLREIQFLKEKILNY